MPKEKVLVFDGGDINAKNIQITDLSDFADALLANAIFTTDSGGQVLLIDKTDFEGGSSATGSPNLDGGLADTNYGGTTIVNCGGADQI